MGVDDVDEKLWLLKMNKKSGKKSSTSSIPGGRNTGFWPKYLPLIFDPPPPPPLVGLSPLGRFIHPPPPPPFGNFSSQSPLPSLTLTNAIIKCYQKNQGVEVGRVTDGGVNKIIEVHVPIFTHPGRCFYGL